MITYRPSDFSEVAPIWREKLWSAEYDFQPTSCMIYPIGYDIDIPKKYSAVFFVAEDGNKIVGVYSGHLTSDEHFRARGLYVDPEYRGQGISRQLFNLILAEAQKQNAKLLWTTPRQGSWATYASFGFTQDSEFMTEGFRYGPNCYASLKVPQQ